MHQKSWQKEKVWDSPMGETPPTTEEPGTSSSSLSRSGSGEEGLAERKHSALGRTEKIKSGGGKCNPYSS